jgi:HK97 gp10 family phage protein
MAGAEGQQDPSWMMKATLSMPKKLQEMMETLATMETDINAVAGEMLDAGADVVLAGMKRRVPKRTGKLHDSLKKGEVQRDGNVSFIEIGLIDAPAEVVRYGTVQEFGSSSVSAQSYLRATMKEDKSKSTKAMKAVLEKELGELE